MNYERKYTIHHNILQFALIQNSFHVSRERCLPNLNDSSDKHGRRVFKQVIIHWLLPTNLSKVRNLSRARGERGNHSWEC